LNDLSKKFLSDPSIQEEEKIVWYRMLEGTSRTADQLSYLKDLLRRKNYNSRNQNRSGKKMEYIN
ncbi:hypothetical protein LEP1GSC116_1405, partial [Leptospira interrogans serovar Icterohaemorrhagiae str. Verdun HP]